MGGGHRTMSNPNPSILIGEQIARLMRGEPLPAPLSAESTELMAAVRCLLSSAAYPVATARYRDELALMMLRELMQHARARVVSEQTLGKVRRA